MAEKRLGYDTKKPKVLIERIMKNEDKKRIAAIIFNPRILEMIKAENYVCGTIGGSAETTEEFRAGLKREKKILAGIQQWLKELPY